MTRWAIVTGEYPPQPGGVSDYTRRIALGLAAAGDAVTIYAPPSHGPTPADPGVTILRLPDHYGPRGLLELDTRLQHNPRPDRILIQYVPHAFGWKAMNLGFTAWVAHRARSIAPVWVMFHEVMSGAARPMKNAVLSALTRRMARQLIRAAERTFVSIPAWERLLRRIASATSPIEWLPIPSNLPETADSHSVAAVRAALPAATQIGHFSTYGEAVRRFLAPAIVPILRNAPDRAVRFLGRGSLEFRDESVARYPDLAQRMMATGELSAEDLSAHLAACDLLLQPYSDGASSRRGSLMAGLALGVPTVTNTGFLSEPIWGTESAGVMVVGSPEPDDLTAAVEALLALTPNERAQRGRDSACWYRTRFALEQIIVRLRSAPTCVSTPAGWA